MNEREIRACMRAKSHLYSRKHIHLRMKERERARHDLYKCTFHVCISTCRVREEEKEKKELVERERRFFLQKKVLVERERRFFLRKSLGRQEKAQRRRDVQDISLRMYFSTCNQGQRTLGCVCRKVCANSRTDWMLATSTTCRNTCVCVLGCVCWCVCVGVCVSVCVCVC